MNSTSEYIKRYLCFCTALLICALGVCLVTKSNLGTSPVTSLPYTITFILPVTLGTTTFIWNVILVACQRVLLKRRLNLVEFLQIPAVFLFSIFIDFWMLTAEPVIELINHNYIGQLGLCIFGSAVLGVGIRIEIVSNATVIPGEGLVIIIANKFRKNFGNIKILFDISLVVSSVILALICLHTVVGLREGTVISAFCVGFFAKIASRYTRKIKPLLWSRQKRTRAAIRHKGCCKA